MEIHEIFRVFAKWLDNNLVTKFRDNRLRIGGLDTETVPCFGPSYTVEQTLVVSVVLIL